MALAQLGAAALAHIKQEKLVSRGLKGASKRTKNKVLKALLRGGSSAAKIFGMSQQAQYRQVRGGNGGGPPRRAPRGTQLTGGITVAAGAAPIQLARSSEINNFFRVLPSRVVNGCVVHCAAQLVPTPSVTSANWSNVTATNVTPANPGFPWISSFSTLFQKYKLRMLRVHYQHYEATTQPGEIVIKYSPDPDDEMISLSESEVGNGSNFIRGAVYEDFCLEADLSGMTKNPLDVTDDTDEDESYAGALGIWCNHYVPAGGWAPEDPPAINPPGNFYVEMVVEFFDRKTQTEALYEDVMAGNVARSRKLSHEQKMAYFEKFIEVRRPKERKPKVTTATMVLSALEPKGSSPAALHSNTLRKKC